MNHVKFMFNRINNYDLLYEDIMEGNQEWGENTKRVEDHTKEYVTQRELLEAFIGNHSELKDTKVQEYCDDGFTGTKLKDRAI